MGDSVIGDRDALISCSSCSQVTNQESQITNLNLEKISSCRRMAVLESA